jgi:hypothetical protein
MNSVRRHAIPTAKGGLWHLTTVKRLVDRVQHLL